MRKEEETRNIKQNNILYEFNSNINKTIKNIFGENKNMEYFYKMFYQKRLKNIWDIFEFLESKNKMDIHKELKKTTDTFFDTHKSTDRFIFFEEDLPSDTINKGYMGEKRIILIDFPYLTAYQIQQWQPDKHVFVIKNIYAVNQNTASSISTSSQYEEIFKSIIRKAVEKKVSDIHIVPKTNFYVVFFRIDGFFMEQNEFRFKVNEGNDLITYLMRRAAREVKGAQFNPDTRLSYQDARVSLKDIGHFDARIAFIPDGYSLKNLEVVIRLLYKQIDMENKDVREELQKLGYMQDDIDILLTLLTKNRGICVISGITNSGKSTLVNHLLSSIKTKKVGTIEDPIEYYTENTNYVQHQLFLSDDDKMNMDFLDYIKAFKRADYDVVFVGEWRNHKGLTDALIEQAFAGQLIFTTLHIANSFQIFEALHYMYGVEFEKLKSVLLFSLNQVLIPKLCDKCKKPTSSIDDRIVNVIKRRIEISTTIDDKNRAKIDSFLAREKRDTKLYIKGEGCGNCSGVGYKGRRVVYDYFVPNYTFFYNLRDFSYSEVLNKAEQHTKTKTKIDIFLDLVKKGEFSINDIMGNEYIASLI